MRTFTTTFNLNTLVIIESLPAGEMHSGSRLHEDISPTCARQHFRTTFNAATNNDDFFGLIRSLHQHIKEDGWLPILHIEAHGAPEDGIVLCPSGDVIRWDRFAAACRWLNAATNNNLVVFVAACHGFESVLSVDIGGVSPFAYLIGPGCEVKAGEVLDGCLKFYRALLADSGTFDSAQSSLPEQFQVYNSEALFVLAFRDYITSHCTTLERRKRTEQLVTDFRRIDPEADYTKARRLARLRLNQPPRKAFEMFKDRFLMSGAAGNEGRFECTFDDMMTGLRGASHQLLSGDT